jgi:hypothetical protein
MTEPPRVCTCLYPVLFASFARTTEAKESPEEVCKRYGSKTSVPRDVRGQVNAWLDNVASEDCATEKQVKRLYTVFHSLDWNPQKSSRKDVTSPVTNDFQDSSAAI